MRRVWMLLAVIGVSVALQAQDPKLAGFWNREMDGLTSALSSPAANARVQRIWYQLVGDTGVMLPVVPAQQFNLGQALPNGVVLLDLGVAGDSDAEVTAFFLAHEYGHQILHHPQMALTPLGRYLAAMGGTAQEDAADRWAAHFLARHGYDFAPVYAFLCALPSGPRGDAHSSGPQRARNVAAVNGDDPDSVCDGAEESTDIETYSVELKIWSRSAGSPMSMDVAVDDDDIGSLSNLDYAETLDLGELTEGSHTFTLTDITVYGMTPYGPGAIAEGLECSGRFSVHGDTTLRLSVAASPAGVQCGVR